jgi:hypothetical protein
VEIMRQRIDPEMQTVFTQATTESTAPAIQIARDMGFEHVPTAPIGFSDLVVDASTVQLATQLRHAVGNDTDAPPFDTRTAVRRELGLVVTGPVLRDQLPVEEQVRFDAVIAGVATRLLGPKVKFPDAPAAVTIAAVAAPCRTGLHAVVSYAAAADRHLVFGAGRVPTAIAMGFVPTFDTPLVARLGRSLNRWILAGAEHVPPNAVTVVVTNPAFIEAVVAGANHEMARELLWRDVPSDPRGTVFSRFWNKPPIPALHAWSQPLGANLSPGGSPYIAVLLRSPLLRRYPNAVVYATQGKRIAADNFEPTGAPRESLYTGFIAPDLTYSVIDLTLAEAIDVAKDWHLLLGEPVTEARFGLDTAADQPGPPLSTWRALAWSDVSGPALSPDHGPATVGVPDGVAWGESSAHMARILHQDPFRIVLRAAAFLQGGN